MTLELDHVFVCPDDPVAAEACLTEMGLAFSRRGVHEGQGTANACAFFDNAYLELLWRHDDDDLRSDLVRPLALWERVRAHDTGASPFGIAFRTADGSPASDDLPAWTYEAPYRPAGAGIPVLTPPHLPDEPLLFLSPGALAPASVASRMGLVLEHRGARRQLTRVRVTVPTAPSPELEAACGLGGVELTMGTAHHLEVELDGGGAGEHHDARPVLPLGIRW